MTIWRMSGRSMGGRGSEMSSKAMVSFMPGTQQGGKRVPVADRIVSAGRMAADGSVSGSMGSGA